MFPVLYHSHHNPYQEDIPFWSALVEETQDPVLELGCGTGRVLTHLIQGQRHVYGLDNDLEMLTFLYEQLQLDLRPFVHAFVADLTRFHLATRFGLILLPCNTYSALSREERMAALACIRDHLAPGGAFSVSLPNPETLWELPESVDTEVEEILTHPQDGGPVQVSNAWQRTGDAFILDWYYDHLLPDGMVQHLTVRIRHSLNSVQDYLEEMRQASFRSFDLMGDFTGTPYEPESPHLIITAR